jgi:choline dehydrogenase-like flavoprotein
MAYDDIIVAGGPAGRVLANRPSADPSLEVLLLEAGGSDWNPLFRMPAGFAKMTKGVASWGGARSRRSISTVASSGTPRPRSSAVVPPSRRSFTPAETQRITPPGRTTSAAKDGATGTCSRISSVASTTSV